MSSPPRSPPRNANSKSQSRYGPQASDTAKIHSFWADVSGETKKEQKKVDLLSKSDNELGFFEAIKKGYVLEEERAKKEEEEEERKQKEWEERYWNKKASGLSEDSDKEEKTKDDTTKGSEEGEQKEKKLSFREKMRLLKQGFNEGAEESYRKDKMRKRMEGGGKEEKSFTETFWADPSMYES